MPFDQRFQNLLQRAGGSPTHWPFGWRLLWSLVLRHQAGLARQLADLREQERQLGQMMSALPELPVSDGLQARLMAVSSRRQMQPVINSRQVSAWGMGMTTALASVMLGFLLGAGGLLAPLDNPDGFEFDSDATYEVSDWLSEDAE